MIALLGKREIRPTAFSFLRRWLSGWKNSKVILSHTTNQLHFDKQLVHNFTLDRDIMIHYTTNVPQCHVRLWTDKCRSSSWRV